MNDDFMSRRECERSHEGLEGKVEIENEHVAAALSGLSGQINRLWDAVDKFRNHVPPWVTLAMSLEALVIGALVTRVIH